MKLVVLATLLLLFPGCGPNYALFTRMADRAEREFDEARGSDKTDSTETDNAKTDLPDKSAKPVETGELNPARCESLSNPDCQRVKGMFWFEGVVGLAPCESGCVSNSEFDRILNNPNYDYIFFQTSPLETLNAHLTKDQLTAYQRRVARLKEAGKKIVVRIWWGKQGKKNWPYEIWGVPNIALQGAVQEAFFGGMVDPLIEFLGPSKLYAIILGGEGVEGTKWDARWPGLCGPKQIPTQCLTREMPARCIGEDGMALVNTNNPLCRACAALIDSATNESSTESNEGRDNNENRGVHMCNVWRNSADFEAQIGHPFYASANGCASGPGPNNGCFRNASVPWDIVREWMGTRMTAKLAADFARHIHVRFQGLKAFAQQGCNLNFEEGASDCASIVNVVDGFLMNTFHGLISYRLMNHVRTMAPNAELLYNSGFNRLDLAPPANPPWREWFVHDWSEKKQIASMVYMSGTDVISFFESNPSWTDKFNRHVNPRYSQYGNEYEQYNKVLSSIRSLPVFRPKHDILIFSTTDTTAGETGNVLSFIKRFDYLTPRESHVADYSKYRMIILSGPQQRLDPPGADADATLLGSIREWNRGEFQKTWKYGGYFEDKELEAYVKNGGLLVLTGLWALGNQRPDFTKDIFAYLDMWYDGVYAEKQVTFKIAGFNSGGAPVPYRIAKLWRMALNDPYGLPTRLASRGGSTLDTDGDYGGGFHFKLGKGAVLVIPSVQKEGDVLSPNYQAWQRYLRDAIALFVQMNGQQGLLASLSNAAEMFGYYNDEMTFPSGEVVEGIVGHANFGPMIKAVQGQDVFEEDRNPVFNRERGGIITKR